MDKKEALNLAQQYASLIQAKYDCKGMILFGSYVKGSYHKESDIDIAVILKEFENPITMRLELMRLRRKIDSRIEPHPFREKEFSATNPIVHEILKHGERIDSDL